MKIKLTRQQLEQFFEITESFEFESNQSESNTLRLKTKTKMFLKDLKEQFFNNPISLKDKRFINLRMKYGIYDISQLLNRLSQYNIVEIEKNQVNRRMKTFKLKS